MLRFGMNIRLNLNKLLDLTTNRFSSEVKRKKQKYLHFLKECVCLLVLNVATMIINYSAVFWRLISLQIPPSCYQNW